MKPTKINTYPSRSTETNSSPWSYISNDPYLLHAEYASANESQLLTCIINTNLVNIPGCAPSAIVPLAPSLRWFHHSSFANCKVQSSKLIKFINLLSHPHSHRSIALQQVLFTLAHQHPLPLGIPLPLHCWAPTLLITLFGSKTVDVSTQGNISHNN